MPLTIPTVQPVSSPTLPHVPAIKPRVSSIKKINPVYFFQIPVHPCIHQELLHARVSTKKLKKIAAERNNNLRADYIQRIAQYSSEQIGFLDEVSKDERTSARSRGRSRKGTRVIKKAVFVRGRRFSATGLLTIDSMISNTVVEGSMTRDLFLEYLEFTVVCYCHGFGCAYIHAALRADAIMHSFPQISQCIGDG